jgi:hypothetical protein
MSDPVWYYAQGDSEKGPLTTAQIKAMTGAGKIRRDDFVWKEGMETWAPARDLPELFDPELSIKTLPPESKATKRKSAETNAEKSSSDVARPLGQLAIALGLLVVLLARGCDSLGNRYVARLDAVSETTQYQFLRDWQSRRELLRAELLGIPDSNQPEAQSVKERLTQLNETMRAKAGQLQASEWGDQQAAAQHARASNLSWGFWREAAFQAGTLVLAIGLLAFGFSVSGPERWICLAILGAILYSIYLSPPPASSNPQINIQTSGIGL